MRLMLDTSAVSFQVTRARKDFGKDVQKVDRDTGRPQCHRVGRHLRYIPDEVNAWLRDQP
jgi:hypothetical protein